MSTTTVTEGTFTIGSPQLIGQQIQPKRKCVRVIHGDWGASDETHYFVYYNPDTMERTLRSLPNKINGHLDCSNAFIDTWMCGPTIINGDLIANHNYFRSFNHAPKIITGHVQISDNPIRNLHNIHEHIKEIGGIFFAQNCPITSHVLGLLLIKKLKRVKLDCKPVQEIINKHLAGDRDTFECQEELLLDYEPFARF